MSENLPQRRSPAEILDSDLLRLCGLPADSPEDVVELVRLVAALVERNGDGPAAAAVALAEAMGRAVGWSVQSLPFGYKGPIVEHKGWVKRDDVALHLAQMGGVLVGGRFNAEVTDKAIAEAVCNYWLREQPFDAWLPGMKSGSGWTTVVRAQPAGLARARELAAAPAEAPLPLKRDRHTQPDPAGIATPALLGQGAPATPQSPSASETKEATQHPFVLCPDGNGWFIRGFGEEGHFTGVRGFKYLAKLLEDPQGEVDITKLVAEAEGDDRLLPVPEGDDVLDPEAIEAYKKAIKTHKKDLEDLDDAIDEADRNNDHGTVEKLEGDMWQIIDQLNKAQGLGGRPRKLGDDRGKLRSRVLMNLKRCREALRDAGLTKLANHFEVAIRTEWPYCYYRPSKRPDWHFSK